MTRLHRGCHWDQSTKKIGWRAKSCTADPQKFEADRIVEYRASIGVLSRESAGQDQQAMARCNEPSDPIAYKILCNPPGSE
jgi:hypothetical protein